MSDERFMQQALDLAGRGRGWVEPNPMVGAVIVRGGEVIGSGWHRQCGGPHAEIEALGDCQQRGHDPAGATMYVSLEPCTHHGRTPPCTDALLEAKLARVVIAMVDPFERVAGEGIRRLREAGIEVTLGIGEAQAHDLNAPFIKRQTTGLPWVILKWAQSLDGRTATRTGRSQWISNEASRRRVHEWRGRVDVIMAGIGTVLADDPQLTARDVELRRVAHRVVVDPDLRLPEHARLVEALGNDHPPVTLAIRQALIDAHDPRILDWEARGVGIIGLPLRDARDPGHLDLEPLMRELTQRHEATNILVEGGAALHGRLIEQGLADQLLAFIAPRLMGDEAALPAVRGLVCETLDDLSELSLHHVEQLDDDVLLDYRVK
ncbi:MAG: bifunctional diaminohydroxyphosphoribosylaminopyrimidine deaminase/5-amino-6-(5-phosphoribosylamino)uracil reductase RibD [Phycisphaeraceae bacterium]